ncbi:hypothetical protein [Halarcobacter ebronensis]|uniref:Uncharacterized protein n=1 Tax=Halarcobacter ebronensis TaxID=1462615 RepID=A0A4Q1AME1_9BACT|nr:hypothetical protein [Halarcobacter ebronensis]QKF81265.1 hypothetical protein AEBR_0765 [Halarcobacter ebronensis]RXK04831.1 hypothetical protein CRV07_09585 [Halarcobacter ebronensis]
MRRENRRDSQVVNNFFTFASIAIISITITIYTNYITEEKPKVLEKLQCEKETPTRVVVTDRKLLKKSVKALDKGYYKIESSFLKSQDDKSTVEKAISLKELEQYYVDNIKNPAKKELEKYLKIRVELIENEKKDENLYAGKLISSFRINSNELLRFESDIKFMYKNAIKDRVDCSMKVYKNYVEN